VARVRLLNCLGFRADESPARAKRPVISVDASASNGRREVTNWLPIHGWTVDQVWARIKASGVPHHPAYDKGMPRLSCVFCIFAPRAALLIGGRHNPDLLDRYVQVERQINHTFRIDLTLASVQEQLQQEPDAPLVAPTDWRM
jgi:3'-phosphoadenosine 5'-phosphosulfate sulfotransferase (PAPS reductase)/FAD synthetase